MVAVVGTEEVEDEALVVVAVGGWADEICVKVVVVVAAVMGAVGTAVVQGLVGVTEVVVVPHGVMAVVSHLPAATLARAGGKFPCRPPAKSPLAPPSSLSPVLRTSFSFRPLHFNPLAFYRA